MKSRIVELIAQIKGDPMLKSTLTASSHLIDDAGLDLLELFQLNLLLEQELEVEIATDRFDCNCLSSLDLYAEYVAEWKTCRTSSGDQRALRELTLQAITALQRGRSAEAESACEKMFAVDDSNSAAYFILSCIRYPGRSYIDMLSRIHRTLRPKTYVEIGVGGGFSLGRALPPTRCVGIDPNPPSSLRFKAETKIVSLRSNDFFARHDLREELSGYPVDLGFIDGSHLFEDVLDDFINLERFCSSSGVLLLHDCLPIDELTASRTPQTEFWTGDVWRLLPVLAHFRPELSVVVPKCAPSGLVIIRNLNPASDVLRKAKEQALAFGFAQEFPDCSTFATLGIELVENDWNRVTRFLNLS
jgi:acyl carrier protein/predicted O-methyltransferase YrrM